MHIVAFGAVSTISLLLASRVVFPLIRTGAVDTAEFTQGELLFLLIFGVLSSILAVLVMMLAG